MSPQDASLLNKLRTGSPTAVREWYKLYHARLLRWLESGVATRSDAEELSQEVFMNCLKHLPLFRGESSIWSWMLSIARHEVADYHRKRYAKKAILALPLSDLLVADDISDAHAVSEKVKLAFSRLSAEAQELLLMKYIDRKTVRAIAEELGKSIKAVESELFRARQTFREHYAVIDGGFYESD